MFSFACKQFYAQEELLCKLMDKCLIFIGDFLYDRLSLGLLFHQDLTSFSRVVVMEQYMFGIAILVNQQE